MRSVLPDGRRVDTYTLLVEDSEANKRHREAEGPQQNVQWITEGKTYMTLTEIDDTTIDVVYDQSAEWLYELRGQVPYIDWIRYAVQVEQLVVPTGLLIG
ncbi:hypothetical protein PHYBOEH_001294 [Phytophthora boehmeriae]|uniref:Uncharacterized protein n=1 Tax=Phytophthora boehmeriae TaxID=109152 RepID=A0A8T1WZX8_9STRA|nr:hypothetical protein PHYBOEH_001294 [Phytophthora boehmeriae]